MTITGPRGTRNARAVRLDNGIPDELPPGYAVGPWIVDKELGRGGMSTVYAVRHQRFGKRAALKLAHRDVFGPRFTADRFLLEARVVNTVNHPDVASIFDAGVIGDRPYLLMEQLTGQTLGDRLEQGPIDLAEITAILLQLCDILTTAHAAGVVHRDLKLDNVFLTTERGRTRVKLLDWGLANLAGEDPMADMIAGTPHYVAPEQVRGEPVTPRSDIYSLGVLAYVLFLGRAPFDAESSAEILSAQVEDLPPPPKERWAEIPLVLEKLILAMLEKRPQDRPDMPEVIESLRCLRRSTPPPIPAVRAKPRLELVPPQAVAASNSNTAIAADHDDHDRAGPPALRVSFTTPIVPTDVLGRMVVLPPLHKQWWIGALVAVGLLAGGLAWRVTAGGQVAAAAPAAIVTTQSPAVPASPIGATLAAQIPVAPAAIVPLATPALPAITAQAERSLLSWPGFAPLQLAEATTCEPALSTCVADAER